jgi:hypothetical protein
MIVQRQRFKVKLGCVDEAIEVMQEMWKLIDPIPHRIYRGITGPFDTIYQELEFEDYEQRQKWWADTGSKIAPLMDKWLALAETGGSGDLFRLVE